MPNAETWVALGGQVGFFLLCFFGIPNSQGLTIGEELFGYRLSQHDHAYKPKHDGSQPQVGPEWTPAIGLELTIELPALPAELSLWWQPQHLPTQPQARGRHATPEPWELPRGLRTI